MGDPKVEVGSADQMKGYIENLPALLQTTAQNVGPYQQTLFGTKQVMAPQELAFEQSLLDYFGPIAAQQEMSLAEMVDPEYFQVRKDAGAKLRQLYGTLDPTQLSGSELENVARGLNRTNQGMGTLNVPTSTSAITNALTFGDRYTQKQKDTAGILSTAAPFLQTAKSGLDVGSRVTGRPSYASNVGQGFGAVPTGLGAQWLGESGQNVRTAQQLNAQRRDALDRFNETFGTVVGSIGSIV